MDDNKDVCFGQDGRFTVSKDCHDDVYPFSTESGSPGELDLMVFDGDIDTFAMQVRLIPLSEDGFSQFRDPPEFPIQHPVIFMSAVRFLFCFFFFTAALCSINARPQLLLSRYGVETCGASQPQSTTFLDTTFGNLT